MQITFTFLYILVGVRHDTVRLHVNTCTRTYLVFALPRHRRGFEDALLQEIFLGPPALAPDDTRSRSSCRRRHGVECKQLQWLGAGER